MSDDMNRGSVSFPVPEARPHIERVSCPECGREFSAGYITTHRRKEHGVVLRASRKDRNGAGNDVVESVLEVIFPGGVPVRHLDAVIRWRAATVQFLQEVEGG